MPGYEVETVTHRIGGSDYRIRALRDRLQYSDDDGAAERAGVPPASWPLFGVVWPAGLALAGVMSVFPVGSRHILETGCGIGLASLVLARRGADITACDHHPLAGAFLQHNSALNGLAPIAFHTAPWLNTTLLPGCYDLIIGSDLLYQRDHALLLSGFIARHAAPASQVLIADPGRGHARAFSVLMAAQGFAGTAQALPMTGSPGLPGTRGRLFSFMRPASI